MLNDSEERRCFVRFARILPLKLSNPDLNREVSAQTHDICAKGIGLVTETPLKLNSDLDIWLYVSENNEPLYSRGKVVWSHPVAPNTYRAGVDLDKVDFLGISRILKLNV